jgi:saccharopine dehydrogenase-like NADP-dependent oxidoreductase
MVGSVMAADFAAHGAGEPWRITIADSREPSLAAAAERCLRASPAAAVTTLRADLSSPAEIARAVRGADLVMGALASGIAFAAMRAVIEAGKNFCDIAFMPEEAAELDGLARSRGVTCVTDCGVAPGMSHMLATLAASELAECRSIAIYVGGLPRERRWPFQYKAAFSPADVIEEYTRPARLVRGGRHVTAEALSEPELLDFEGVGTLEAFNTDGLRSLVRTLGPGSPRPVPDMVEKTLRYPGHIELMRVMRAAGLFGTEPVRVGGAMVVPRELTAALVFPQWTYQPGEEDLTVMRVWAQGTAAPADPAAHPEGVGLTRVTYDLLDTYHRPSGATSMARTTALPATIVGRMIHSGRVRGPGVIVPELLGWDRPVMDQLLAELKARGVVYTRSVSGVPREA